MNALDYSLTYSGRKILVLEPLLELGKNAKKDHEILGEEAGKICDFLFLTNNNYAGSVRAGVGKSRGRCVVKILPPSAIAKFVRSQCSPKDVVIFEGRQAKQSLLLVGSDSVYGT
jgi:UDP-N-acetylmuramyl pentapeptide synthase